MGVSGDRIQNLLWRLDHGALDCAKPAGVVLAIGTNNVHYYSADEIVLGISAVVERIRRLHPNASIVVLSLLPRDKPKSRARSIVRQVNSKLPGSLKDKERVEFLDVGSDFVDGADEILTSLIPDLLHPNESGYRQLANSLRPWIRRLSGPE
jgi:beta-glucosidase